MADDVDGARLNAAERRWRVRARFVEKIRMQFKPPRRGIFATRWVPNSMKQIIGESDRGTKSRPISCKPVELTGTDCDILGPERSRRDSSRRKSQELEARDLAEGVAKLNRTTPSNCIGSLDAHDKVGILATLRNRTRSRRGRLLSPANSAGTPDLPTEYLGLPPAGPQGRRSNTADTPDLPDGFMKSPR